MQMSIHSPLPALAKRVFISKGSCLRWASDLFSQFAFARCGQATYFPNLPLPTLGKSFFDLFHYFFAFLASRSI